MKIRNSIVSSWVPLSNQIQTFACPHCGGSILQKIVCKTSIMIQRQSGANGRLVSRPDTTTTTRCKEYKCERCKAKFKKESELKKLSPTFEQSKTAAVIAMDERPYWLEK